MNIVVYIRPVVDVTVPLTFDKTGKGLSDEGLCHILNPADRCAVEEAVRIKEKWNSGAVTVVAMGSSRVEDFLRECMGMGADRAAHLLDRSFDGSDDFATATALSKLVQANAFDLFLSGSRTLDGSSAMVGGILAELLDLPHVSGVTRLELSPDRDKVFLQRKLERGNRQVLECPLPAVLSLEDGLNNPRYPSLPAYMEGLQKPIEVKNAKALGLGYREVGQQGSLTKIVGMKPPQPRTKKSSVDIGSMSQAEKIKFLTGGGVAKKDSGVIEGDTRHLVQETLKILQKQGIT